MKSIDEVISEWKAHGEDTFDADGIIMPAHPEYVFRLTGEWTGWNDVCGVQEGDEQYEYNLAVDAIENAAWERITQ
jgi:hypothetical protein